MAGYRPPDMAAPDRVTRDRPVVHDGPFAKIWFGPGASGQIANLVAELGAARPAVLCTADRSADGGAIQGLLPAETMLMAEAVMHSPAEVSDRLAERAAGAGVDLLVSIGGGSSIGLGKALTKRLGLRHISLPTTYAGSEITPILGETRDGDKLTLRDDALRPSHVIYDPLLNLSLPVPIAMASGMNALAHAVEALTTTDDADIVGAAETAARCLIESLPAIAHNPGDDGARARALYGSWLAGYCLAEAPMALHHKLCHALGGAHDMPHAETHAALLPHSFAYNAPASPQAAGRLGALFGGDAADGLFDLVTRLGLKTRLRDLGLPGEGIDGVARLACANPYANPRPFTQADIAALLTRAWRGDRPATGAA